MREASHPQGPTLVTGASGFIGRHLVRALLRQNRPVLALCRHPGSTRDLEHPLLEVITGVLEEPHVYAPHLNDQLTVFHLAAVRNLAGASSETFRRINETACVELGRASAQARVAKFVYVSTALVFGPSDGRCVTEDNGYCREMMENSYIRSRVQAIEGMRNLVGHGLRLVTVCPTIVFGPDDPSHPNRVTTHLRRALRSGVGVVVGGGHQRRNLVHVGDLVRGVLLAERSGDVGEEYILGGDDLTHREFNRMAFTVAGRKAFLRLSVPVGIARAAAKVTDRVCGYDRGSGYEAAVGMLTKEWRYSSQKAKQKLGYGWMPVREGILQTLQSIERA